MDKRLIVVLSLVFVIALVAGCTQSSNSPSKKVPAEHKTTVQTSYDATAALAEAVEVLDAMIASTTFSNGTGGTVTVAGHGTTTVVATWTGNAASGTATLTVKSGSTTVSTYTVTFTGTSIFGITSLVTKVTGKTAKGADLDLGINIVKTGTTCQASIVGNVTYSGKKYSVSGGSTTDSVAKTASWGYVITDTQTEITVTIAASYAQGSFSGAMTITTKSGKPIATVATSAGGKVTVTYEDGKTETIEVFPDPTK